MEEVAQMNPDHPNTLEEIVEACGRLGTLHVYQSEVITGWSATIKFETPAHIKLEAKSGFKHPDMKSALLKAIERAEVIKKEFAK